MRGTEGGRDAAFKLRQHITANHDANTDILVHIFFNRQGLSRALKTHLNIQPGIFSAFIDGFNTASPFMSILDVGVGKEAADAKIRGGYLIGRSLSNNYISLHIYADRTHADVCSLSPR